MDDQIQTVQTPTKKFSKGKLIAIIVGILVLIGGLTAGLILVRKQQLLKEEAAQCVEQCPGSDGILRNCHPPEADGSPQESICNRTGRIESCGGRQYCCPSVNGTWTTTLSACSTTETSCNDVLDNDNDGKTDCLDSDCANSTYCQDVEVSPTQSASPTVTVSTSPTATATPTATKTPTVTSTISATASPPIPESGIGSPTVLGVGLGTILLIISLALIF
jgi:hypothetical protein